MTWELRLFGMVLLQQSPAFKTFLCLSLKRVFSERHNASTAAGVLTQLVVSIANNENVVISPWLSPHALDPVGRGRSYARAPTSEAINQNFVGRSPTRWIGKPTSDSVVYLYVERSTALLELNLITYIGVVNNLTGLIPSPRPTAMTAIEGDGGRSELSLLVLCTTFSSQDWWSDLI